MATRVSHRASVATLSAAAVLLLLVTSAASAQRWRFGLGAAAAWSMWSPAIPQADGGTVGFDPSPFGLGDATFWLAPSLGLRLDGSFAQPDLVFRRSGQSATTLVPSTRLTTAEASLLVPPFGARPLSFLRTRVLPYITFGGGVTMVDPGSDASCPLTAADARCGPGFTTGTTSYMLERGARPSMRAALGMDVGLGAHTGLRFEVGGRSTRSPVVRLATDANGNVVRGATSGMMHGTYASLGLEIHTRNVSQPKPDEIPLVAVGVGGGSAPIAAGGAATVGTALDKLAGSPKIANRNRPAPVSRVVPIDSAKPRAIGKDSIYDVVLDIPNVSIDEITLEVNNIHAHVSLDAKVAKLVELAVGADAGIDRVYLGIRGVQAEAHLKVDLDNVATIVDRVLTTIDRNPEIITGLLETLETTVNTVGNVANTALAPNGVVAQTVGTVGQIANTALQPGGVVTDLVNTVGSVANTALAPNGVVAQTVGTLGDVANTALAPNGVLAQTVNTVGNVANTALQPNGVVSQAVGTVGDIANNAVNTVGGVANTTLQPGGVVSNLTTAVGGAVQNLTAQGGLLSPMGVNALGQTVARIVDASGQIIVRATDAAGRITGQNVVGNVLQLPVLQQGITPNGLIQRVVRDVSGSLIMVLLDNAGRVLGTQVLQAAASAGVVVPQGIPRDDEEESQEETQSADPERRAAGPSASIDEYDVFAYTAQQIPLANQASDTGGVAPKLLILAATINDKGEMVQRYVEGSGLLMERTIDPLDGRVTMVKSVGNVFRLPLVSQRVDPATGALVRVVREPRTGATIDLTFSQAGKLERIRVDQMGAMTGATMATAAVTAGRSPASPAPTAMPGTLVPPVPLPPNGLPVGAIPAVSGTLLGNVLAGNAQPAANAPNAPNVPLANLPLAANAPLAPVAPNAPLAANAPLAVNAALAGNMPNAASINAAAAATTIMPSIAASAIVGNTGLNLQGALPGLDSTNTPRQTALVDPDTTKPLLLLSQRVNDRGQIVIRVVDLEGKITERSLNAAGQLVVKKGAANARLLPLVREYADPKGQYVRLVRDTFGAILELDFSAQGKLFRVRVLNRPDADVNGAAAAAANLPSAIIQVVNSLGQMIQHVVLTNGTIVERVVDRAGNILRQQQVGSVLNLPALIALAQPNGQLVVVARDPTGALLEIVMRASDRMLLSLRTLDTGAMRR